jgi:RNA polymerase sigma factor (sigma-70 family)
MPEKGGFRNQRCDSFFLCFCPIFRALVTIPWMNNSTHQQLLRDYVERRSEAAFADLVRGHIDFVYSAALRMLRDPHLAEDVTQSVFMALAQNARQLTERPVLLGWLHRTTQNLSANAIRSEVRRRAREQEAATMNPSPCTEPDPVWQEIAPQLDAALEELSEAERDALLLRYFENKSAREMAEVFRISDEAAQKRVTRAVERLRKSFARRGITVGANALVVLIASNAVQAAPAGLAVTISTATVLAGTALSTTITATAPQAIAMTTLQKTVIATVLTAAIGTGVYEAAQNSNLRDHVQILERRQAPLVDAANQLAALQAENESLKSNQSSAELLQLRGEVARLRDAASRAMRAEAEVAQLKSAFESRQGLGTGAATIAPDASSAALINFLGEAVPPPPDMNPAYTKEGLLGAIHQAAQLANVPLKQVQIETSEFPFLVGLVCDSEADFEKLKAQFKNMANYDYRGGTSSHGTYAFNMIPYSSWPSDAAQRIGRRTTVRASMLYDQLRH